MFTQLLSTQDLTLLLFGCRAARLCHSAAHGGQILAPYELVQHLVKTWTGADLELATHHKTAKPHSDAGKTGRTMPP